MGGWVDCCGAAGGGVEPHGNGQFRILRDGIQMLWMYQETLDEAGEVHVVER